MLKFASGVGKIQYDMDRTDPCGMLACLRQACGIIVGDISDQVDKPFEELMMVFAQSLVEGEYDPIISIDESNLN